MRFFDTSVFVAAFWSGHPDHEASLRVVASADIETCACSVDSLAEVYATMTALPVKDVIPPDQAFLFVEEVRHRCSLVVLDQDEYCSAIERAANAGFTSGRICDALLLRCAAKVNADIIYTWNLAHFKATDPTQAHKIRTP